MVFAAANTIFDNGTDRYDVVTDVLEAIWVYVCTALTAPSIVYNIITSLTKVLLAARRVFAAAKTSWRHADRLRGRKTVFATAKTVSAAAKTVFAAAKTVLA